MRDNADYGKADWEEVSRLRGCVERWMRIKFAQDNLDTKMYRDVFAGDYDRVVQQLRNDALHSGLLMRLFLGEEPDDRNNARCLRG